MVTEVYTDTCTSHCGHASQCKALGKRNLALSTLAVTAASFKSHLNPKNPEQFDLDFAHH